MNATQIAKDNFGIVLDSDIKSSLSSKVKKIDRGYYPKHILRALAKQGYFTNNIASTKIINDIDSISNLKPKANKSDFSSFLVQALRSISAISSICGTTGFCVWCQQALSWYLANSKNITLRDEILETVHKGYLLGGTGLSNPMKSYANIENNSLKANKVDQGYIIKGMLPWVSNIEYGHVFATIFPVTNGISNTRFVMGLVHCEEDKGIALGDNISFIGLDGSATKSVKFKDYFMPEGDCIANPAESILISITAGFIILQMGMGIGIISSCLKQMKKSNITHSHINGFLNISENELEDSYQLLANKAMELAKTPYKSDSKEYMLDVLNTRLEFSKLALKASNAACLYSGAKGYIKGSDAERLLRESYFIAMVTPSIKHLQKELYDISQGRGVMKQWKESLANIK